MDNETLLYIEDDKKQKLFYRFTPAAFVSNFVPLIVVLDGEGNSEAENFEHKMWHVLTPVGHVEDEKDDAGWLGKKELLQTLIHEIAEAYECEDHIYLYGSAMGGYGAILHGILCRANAVFAHLPHIRLQTSSSPDIAMRSKENDLTEFLNATDPFPIFYLCDDGTANAHRTEEETAYFVGACKKYDIKVHQDFCPTIAEDGTPNLKEVLDFFERVASEG